MINVTKIMAKADGAMTGPVREPRSWSGIGQRPPLRTARYQAVQWLDREHFVFVKHAADDDEGENYKTTTFYRDGDKTGLLVDGVLVGDGAACYEEFACAILRELLGPCFSGYEHNYVISDGFVYDESYTG